MSRNKKLIFLSQELHCKKDVCHGAVVNRPMAKKPRVEKRSIEEVLEQAIDFMDQYYSSLKK